MTLTIGFILLDPKAGCIAWITDDWRSIRVRVVNPQAARHGRNQLLLVLDREPGCDGEPECEVVPLDQAAECMEAVWDMRVGGVGVEEVVVKGRADRQVATT